MQGQALKCIKTSLEALHMEHIYISVLTFSQALQSMDLTSRSNILTILKYYGKLFLGTPL